MESEARLSTPSTSVLDIIQFVLSALEQAPRTHEKFQQDATGIYAVGPFLFINNKV